MNLILPQNFSKFGICNPLPLTTVTEPPVALMCQGGNKIATAMIKREIVLEKTNTTGSNVVIYSAEDTALQFL